MNHHHTLCADANSPLDVLRGNVESYLQLGAAPEKMILGVPFYGYMKRCNDSIPQPSTFSQCAGATCLVGDAEHYDEAGPYGLGVWAIERLLANKTASAGCVQGWSEKHSSPYLDCPASSPGPYFLFHRQPPPGKPMRTQTWYDDSRSTRLKVEMAKALKLGGVGAFTGENVGPPGNNGFAESFWSALAAIKSGDASVSKIGSSIRSLAED